MKPVKRKTMGKVSQSHTDSEHRNVGYPKCNCKNVAQRAQVAALHQGIRLGVRRKHLAKKWQPLICRVSPRTKAIIAQAAADTGEGFGAVIDFIVADYENRLRKE